MIIYCLSAGVYTALHNSPAIVLVYGEMRLINRNANNKKVHNKRRALVPKPQLTQKVHTFQNTKDFQLKKKKPQPQNKMQNKNLKNSTTNRESTQGKTRTKAQENIAAEKQNRYKLRKDTLKNNTG